MKHTLLVLVLMATAMNCKAQSPIYSLAEKNIPDDYTGAYFKDIDGDLDKFVGTWKYTNGNTSLTISFKKLTQFYNGDWYYDQLVGEYKYVENGVVVVDFLSRLNSPLVEDGLHYIDGCIIIYPKQFVECTDCDLLERRILLDFDDPQRRYLSNALAIRYVNDNGVEKIEAQLRRSPGASLVLADDEAHEPRVPYGDYVLIKQ